MNDFNFDELVKSMKEAIAIEKGTQKPSRKFTYTPLDVKAIREKTHKSQIEFSNMLGINVGTLRNWEQGIRKPDGAATTLLRLVAANPQFVESVLYN